MAKPIRILQVFTTLNRGGAEVNMMNYLRNMDCSKFQMDFLLHRSERGAFEEEVKEYGCQVFHVPALHPLKLNAYRKEVQSFFQEHSDYDIVHGQTSEIGAIIYEEAEKQKIPVIIAHAHLAKMNWDVKSPFRLVWRRLTRQFADTYFTCSQDAAVWLFGKKGAKRAWQMNNAIDTEIFRYNPAVRENIRRQLDLKTELCFLCVARFQKQKNHLFLLDVFSQIIKLQPDTKLFLVGDGELQSAIEMKIDDLNLQNSVLLLGLRSDVNVLMQAMDVFLMPSLFEGLPVSLVEAQASGLHCVISDTISEESILIDDLVRMISLKDSPKKWAEEIIAFSDYERKDTSPLILEKGYDIRENAKRLEQKYVELLQQASKK